MNYELITIVNTYAPLIGISTGIGIYYLYHLLKKKIKSEEDEETNEY